MATTRTVKKCPRCRNRYMKKVLKVSNTMAGNVPLYEDPRKSPLILNKYMKIMPVWECIGCGRTISLEVASDIPDYSTRLASNGPPRR